MSVFQIACALFVEVIWGYQFIAIKQGLSQFSPLFFCTLRFGLIAVLLIPFVPRPRRRELGPIALMSVFLYTLNLGLSYVALAYGNGTVISVIYQLATPFIVLLAWPALHETPSPRVLFGVFLAFCGVAVAARSDGSSALLPAVLVALAALMFAIGNVLVKLCGPFDSLMLMAWASLFTLPQMLLGTLVFEHGQWASLFSASLTGWWGLFYTTIFGGIVGFGLWFWLISVCSMNRVAPFGLLMPIFTAISSLLILDEKFTATLMVGATMAIVGVGITQLRASPAPSVAPPL